MEKLGEPIDIDYIDEKDNFNFKTDHELRSKMLVKGKKRAADFYVYANRGNDDRKWNINALEIKYFGQPNKYRFYEKK